MHKKRNLHGVTKSLNVFVVIDFTYIEKFKTAGAKAQASVAVFIGGAFSRKLEPQWTSNHGLIYTARFTIAECNYISNSLIII